MANSSRTWREHAIGLGVLIHLVLVVPTVLPDAGRAGGCFGEAGVQYNRMHFEYHKRLKVYGGTFGPKQYWGMFAGSGPASTAGLIEIKSDKGWREIYRSRSSTATWNRAAFDHYRCREMFAITAEKKGNSRVDHFADWLVTEVAEDFPESCAVRVLFAAGEALSPEELRAGVHRTFDTPQKASVRRIAGRSCAP